MKAGIGFLLAVLAFGAITPEQEAEWRSEIRRTLFVPQPLPELDSDTHGQFEPAPGVVAERVTYATQFGMSVPAILYLPAQRQGPVPALIVVNGHGGDKYSWYSFYTGILYARAGAAVLTYDPIGEGERNAQRQSGTRAHDRKLDPPEMGRRMGGLMMTDVMQAVSYLSSRLEVDPKRIASMGYSMGSFVLGLTCAVDTRLAACVLVGGGNLDGPSGYWDNSKPMCQGTPYRSLSFLGDRPAILYALHASRGPTLIYNGLEDTVVAIPRYGPDHLAAVKQRAAKLRGSEEGLFETGFVEGASHRPWFITRPVAQWLERHLDFPNWTEAAIDQMPETLVSDWTTREQIDMDPLYATQHREGGTRALGVDVPFLSRHELSVFSPRHWQQHMDEFIYERWVENASQQTADYCDLRVELVDRKGERSDATVRAVSRDDTVLAEADSVDGIAELCDIGIQPFDLVIRNHHCGEIVYPNRTVEWPRGDSLKITLYSCAHSMLLSDGCTFLLRVRDPDGTPLPGAQLTTNGKKPFREADSHGRIWGVISGALVGTVDAPGLAGKTVELECREDRLQVERAIELVE